MYRISDEALFFVLTFILGLGCFGQSSDGDARLYGGKDGEGIVQIYQNSSWRTICDLNFHGVEARVVCRQLGFNDGFHLPVAAYGEYTDIEPYPEILRHCQTGQEARLVDCTFDVNAACNPVTFAYASVKCFNNTQPPTNTLKLENENGPDAGYFSSLSVYRFGTWGQICGEFWDHQDATVACQQLGYRGGMASFFERGQNVPLLLGRIECQGNETKLEDCEETEQFCYTSKVAGVFCYKSEAPQFSLAGGTERYGKVVLSVDGSAGVLCKTGLEYITADLICKEIGFHSGYDLDKVFEAPNVTEVFLQDVACTGDDRSFWACQNGGWGHVSGACQDPVNGYSIYCYSDVRLFSAMEETADLFAGRVELWDERWRAVCAEILTQDLANLICSEFGFPIAEVLSPDAFGRRPSSMNVNSIQCSGTETSLSQCNYTLGVCPLHQEQSNLLCRQENLTPGEKLTLSSGSYYDRVYLERYGIEGTICRRGWDDKDAAVVCRMLSYKYGFALGTSSLFARYKPVWNADVGCYGNETDLRDCRFTAVGGDDWDCTEDLVAAGVLCSNDTVKDPPVRLTDGISDAHGRVEVFHEKVGWGTICNTEWSVSDADVVCRQLGFAEGQTHANAYSGTAQGPVVLNGINCDGSETSILQCPSKGWNRVSSTCDHSRDAGVFCYKHVTLTPSAFYGAILIHKGDYRLVCADGFNQDAADVTCREVDPNFVHSKVLCCSALGPQNYNIGVSDVTCFGDEDSLRFCNHRYDSPSCPSGNYAAVVCSSFDGPYQRTTVLGDGRVRVNYFINDGFICAEDFSDNDAKVVCKDQGFSFGYGIKASALGIEHSIRWLRDLQCIGNERNITSCPNVRWGQIGVCDWTMVAGVVCTQDEAGLDFDIRLVNGTESSGRVEVKINSEWGTICGTDFTKNEAVVICKQLGFFDGVALEAGNHGGGSGEVILNGMTCTGRESTLKDCVWSGYKQTSGLCDHSKDAAVRCYTNLRLTGSTTANYGRPEVYHSDDADWLAICDYGLNINDANVLCRMLGYNTGLYKQGSPLGPTNQPITISEVDCFSQSTCRFKTGVCRSGKYVALYCSEGVITTQGAKARLPLSSHYGPVEIRRYGLWGAVCDLDFTNEDAQVICKGLNFKSGYRLSTPRTDRFPLIQGGMTCSETATSVADCDLGNFADEHGCYNRSWVAGVFCFQNDGVQYKRATIDPRTGVMETLVEIIVVGQTLYVAADGFSDVDATVYCKTLGLAGGTASLGGTGEYQVKDVDCKGGETSIFQCQATWDPRKTGQGSLAGVTCYRAVSLLHGNYDNHGVLYSVRGSDYGPVCAEGFDETDAGVACRNLGFDAGLVLCCSVYGPLTDTPIMTNVQCNGNEEMFTDCRHDNVLASEVSACRVNYAAVACYNGTKNSDYSVSLPTTSTYNGVVILTYLGVDGRICSDGWDSNDASVVCKELGYFTGFAQITQREDVRLSVSNGPYWTSNINCTGTETRLADCEKTELGTVTKCENRHYAGVICYDREGLFYRLGGSDEARYGRVEVSIQGEFRSICDLYWGNTEAHVLCKMLGYRTGEAYHGSYIDTAQGTVWDANFQCTGSESRLNDCPFTSWEVATSPECAAHQNDAGAFCYTSVKLSTGVGRATDRGAVLLYWNDKWNTICSDDFNDTSARVVCRELGFEDGQAQCCSAFGGLPQYGHVVTHKVKCRGNENDVTSCLVEEVCQTQQYASVVCYGFLLTTETVTAPPPEEQKFNPTPIIIAIVVFVVLVIIALIIAYCVIKRRKRLKLDKSKEHFDHRIVSETGDSSIVVNNPMHGIGTPEVTRVRYTAGDREPEASISPAYLNSAYNIEPGDSSRDPVDTSGIQPVVAEEPAQTGSNRTVININSQGYQKLAAKSGKENPYDNMTESNASASVKSNTYDSIRDSGQQGDGFQSTMVEQPHLSSPYDSVHELKWPDPKQND